MQIIWTGTQWEIQGDDPNISGVNFVAAWFNTDDTPTPPEGCWQSSFGCSIPAISGQDAHPTEYVSDIVNLDPNPTLAQTVEYLMSSKWFKSSVFRRKRLKSLQMVILAR